MSALDDLDSATSVTPIGEGRFTGQVVEGWDIAGVPHGGFLLALLARAASAVVRQPDPLSISASYLSAPAFGDVELQVGVLRAGRRQSTAEIRLLQDGQDRVHAVATFGTLGDETPEPLARELAARPRLPGPDDCLSSADEAGSLRPNPGLHRHVDIRLHPETGWIRGEPSGRGTVEGWVRMRDRPTDLPALLLISDALPPSVFDLAGLAAGHTPTMQLTTHLFARPDTAWVQARSRTRLIAGSLLDEDTDLWDANGKVLGTARQLALLRR